MILDSELMFTMSQYIKCSKCINFLNYTRKILIVYTVCKKQFVFPAVLTKVICGWSSSTDFQRYNNNTLSFNYDTCFLTIIQGEVHSKKLIFVSAFSK